MGKFLIHSELLDGFWEEGYHYYVEIKKNKFTLRDYAKRVIFETRLKYDKKALKAGERCELELGETVISRTAAGEPMIYITAFYYENGEIHMDTHYTIMGDSSYTLKKVDHGPFDNIEIMDKEFLPMLQGEWYEWRRDGDLSSKFVIKKNVLTHCYNDSILFEQKIHVIRYKTQKDRLLIVSEDLTDSSLHGWTFLEVEPDMLTGRMIVMDARVPLSVFARKDKLDRIPIPPEALEPMRNTMLPPEEPMVDVPKTTDKKDE